MTFNPVTEFVRRAENEDRRRRGGVANEVDNKGRKWVDGEMNTQKGGKEERRERRKEDETGEGLVTWRRGNRLNGSGRMN